MDAFCLWYLPLAFQQEIEDMMDQTSTLIKAVKEALKELDAEGKAHAKKYYLSIHVPFSSAFLLELLCPSLLTTKKSNRSTTISLFTPPAWSQSKVGVGEDVVAPAYSRHMKRRVVLV